MKTIGLIGGMSWESTVSYYRIINEEIKKQLGGLHSAKVVLYSVDFAEIEKCQAEGDWCKSARILTEAAQSLEKAGADYICICTNTMHKVVTLIQQGIHIPIIHIAEATAQKLQQEHIQKVALLGTKYTMTQMFYKQKLIDAKIDVLVPSESDNELCLGVISNDSKEKYIKIIKDLVLQGAQGVILGCTEIGLLIHQEDMSIPVFDTTQIHAQKAAIMAIENSYVKEKNK